jgi:hypothetical protein
MGHGLTVERLKDSRIRVFDSACQWTTIYLVFDGIILCESGTDCLEYRLAAESLEKTDGSVSTFEIYRRAGVRS